MKPWGIGGDDESVKFTGSFDAFVNAGVHSSTKTYIEPSNSDWIKPKYKTFLSRKIISNRIKNELWNQFQFN